MNQPLAFLNGQWIPAAELAVAPIDAGFVLGVTIAEQLRTFGGRLFHLDDHLRRLRDSLEIIGVDPRLSAEEMAAAAVELVGRNHRLIDPADDLGLSIFVTPGDYASYATTPTPRPTVAMHTYLLPFHLWAEKYEAGQAIVVSQVRQVPPSCWPPQVKCRSRMHYYLADREAAARDSGARAVLLDHEGCLSEASTANVVLYRREEGLVSPPQTKILHGISLAVVFALAESLGLPVVERDIRGEELDTADEIMLTSTPLCLLPVTRCNGRPVGAGSLGEIGRPGEVCRALLRAWSAQAGFDIAAQARRFAVRGPALPGETPV